MDTYKDIRITLESKLASTSGLPQIAWENVRFDPQEGTSWIRARVLPVNRTPAVRGQSGPQRYTGIYELMVYTPEGKGPHEAESIVSKLIDAFPQSSDIIGTDVTVRIRYAEREAGIVSSPWYYVPVIISYFAYEE